jgi:hypothetical protein
MAGEVPERHPGGRTCAGAMLVLACAMIAGGGLLFGIVWAVLR